MEEKDPLVDEILDHGPSPGTLVLVLSRMKEEGRINDVIRACVRFLPLYPDDVRLRKLLAESYAEKGFVALAESEWEKAALMIDRLAPVYRSLADMYEKQGRYGEAADMLRRYLAHYPGEAGSLESYRRIEAALGSGEALPEPETSVEGLAPEEEAPAEELVDFATPTIAELYFSQGRIDAAIQTYERVVKGHPEDRDAIERLNELKKMVEPSEGRDEGDRPSPLRIEERMITVMERWLVWIRELRYV